MSQNILSAFDFTKKRNWVRHYYNFDIKHFERLLQTKGEEFWQKEGDKQALRIFHQASQRVPAYKDFLKRHKVKPKLVKGIKDFKQIPITNKQNYIKAYQIEKRCWDGNLPQSQLVAVSSGTTGKPALWPRGSFQEYEAAIIHELLYRKYFEIHKYPTLLIIGFPMGVYVSGIATTLPSWLIVQKGYGCTLVTVGNNKNQVLDIVKEMPKAYKQIALIGHPFFIKDIIETGRKKQIQWNKRRIKLMFCSEGFSESWREYLKERACIVDNSSIISTYGSSEMLLIGYETLLSVDIRKKLDKSNRLRKILFPQQSNITPSLFQFNPLLRYIESIKDELVFTVASGIPLMRFNLHDAGEVVSYKQIIREAGVQQEQFHTSWKLPFVTLRERTDRTLIFYAANLYPEHIQAALNNKMFFAKLTGKFVMRKDYLKNMDQFLEINIELKQGVRKSSELEKFLQNHIVTELRKVNMEYLFLCNHLDKDLTPRIALWPYGDERYFKPGLKPRFVQ